MRKSGYRTVFHSYLIFFLAMRGAMRAASGLLEDRDRLTAMSRALSALSVTDAAEEIYQTLIRLVQ